MGEERTGKLDLSAKRRALLEALLREQDAANSATGKIPRRTDQGPAPLSFAQERLWFLDQYYPGSSIYNVPAAFPLYGPLNVTFVQATLNEIIRRHEVLRTTFTSIDGRPMQVVAPKLELEVAVADLLTVAEDQRQQAAAQLIDAESNKSFDLSKGPLLKAVLMRVAEQGHYLFLNMHHIISDGWSVQVFINEFNTIYQALASGGSPSLPELPIQYADFAVWQRKYLQGEVLDTQLSYWKQQLEGMPSAGMELPTDHFRPQVSTFRGASVSFMLSLPLSEKLWALTQRAGITPFISLLTAFKALLFRYTEESSVIIGIPSTNRNRTELEGLIGFFVNTLVLRTNVSPDLSFTQLLERVREVMMGAHAHQDVPFEKIVEELQPTRNPNINPLFQIMFDFHNHPQTTAGANQTSPPADESQNATSELVISEVSSGTSKFDLSLSMMHDGRRIGGGLAYSTDLFDHTTILRLIGHFDTLLHAIVDNPDKAIGELPLMAPAERHQVLVEWNDTKNPFPEDVCVHQQFEEQVERTPNEVAAVFEDQQLTYLELNRRANRLAHYLRSRGVGPEVIVGICMDSTLEMLVSIFGIVKAGGAYLPVEPRYPHDRAAFMLDDAGVQIVITHQHYKERMTGLGPENILVLDEEASALLQQSTENPPPLATSANTCYVIYTSGSTGRPKGVMIEHKSLVNLIQAMQKIDGVGPGRRVLQFSSFSFDVSVREVFGTLVDGGTLYLERRESLMPGEPLARVLRENKITDVNLPPSVWAYLPDTDLPELKVAVAGGEACPPNIVTRWAHGRTFFNGYGPTEITFGSSFARCSPGDGKPTIGRPIANATYYVVDRNLQPCVIGKVGELLIGGAGLARGYLGRPDLTAERFIPDFLSGEPGARLYCTGDLVRLLPDGDVDYIGRIDQQIKIRGFRIELGEIETVLSGHPNVSASAVICREESSIDKELVAYLVAAGRELSNEELRLFLATKLPEYMIPQIFIFLERMPLTPTGKVDLRQLPSPDTEHRRKAYVAPRNPVEQVIAEIWAGVLGVDRVGIYDNFFELGGHSLLVTQVVSRMRDIFQIEIPVRRLFEAPTVAELALSLVKDPHLGQKVENAAKLLIQLNELGDEEVEQLLQKASAGEALSSVVAAPAVPEKIESPAVRNQNELSFSSSLSRIRRRQSTEPAPLSFAQERLWFLDQFQPGSTAYNVFRPFPFRGPINLAALEKSLNEIVRRHETLRTTFQVRDGSPVQVIAPSAEVNLVVEDLRHLPDQEKQIKSAQIIQETVLRHFDLAQGPLMRPFLLIYTDYEQLLGLSIHHIISDAWSMRVFYGELMTLYQAFHLGMPSPLQELPIQYADFAVWQRQRMQGEVLQEHLAFWRQQFEGAPAALELPLDHQRPPKDTYQGAMELFAFSQQISVSLERLSLEEKVTMFMTLLATFMTLLYRYTGQHKIAVGAPIANRNRAEVEGLIGFFTNTLVLCTELGDNPTFRQLLRRVREMTLGAYAHEDLPFERLVEELNPERNLHINPLFQVMFVLQKATGAFPSPSPEQANSDDASAAAGSVAKFDLTLYMEETDQGLIGGVEYATELFERTTVQRMLKHFQMLLEAIALNPGQPISQLEMLLPSEQHQLLNEWSVGKPVTPGELGIHSLVEAQVERTPEAIALIGNDGSLNYLELNEAANKLAHYLIGSGVRPEACVGVCMNRGSDLMIALLGILKAGGVYLPLDPSFPKDRLAFMMADAQVQTLITEESLLGRLPENSARVLLFDREAEWLSQAGSENPVVGVVADHAACLIYTSGSTGVPKGAMLRHRTLTGLVEWQIGESQLPEAARTIQYSSPSFDVSLQEIFSAWCSGGTLCCIGEEDREDFTRIIRYLADNSIERIFLPYVALQQLAEVADGNKHAERLVLRHVMCGGEQLKITPAIAKFFARLNGCRLFNHYGPTETHVTCEHELEGRPDTWEWLPPIGRPVAGARYYVLDRWGGPVPIGVPGELFIGGPGISRGYLNCPEMTAEKYVPNPFGGVHGARMYRTGDLVRYRHDGNLEFVGRIDQQLKIRGFRVEPGEIEACLTQHPSVVEAVIVTRELSSGEKQLVGYVVPSLGATPTAVELRDYLRAKLPDYMVPSHFLFLDSLPLTATGKLDRRHLPKPDLSRAKSEQTLMAPRSPLEQNIAAIWSEVLGLENIGVQDNFFDLGGHSLLATQIVSRLRTQFGIEVALRRLFEEPTIEGLARAVVQSELEQVDDQNLAALIGDLEQMPEEEIDKLLSEEPTGILSQQLNAEAKKGSLDGQDEPMGDGPGA
jgi:amino acid adenylation domain-containing protein